MPLPRRRLSELLTLYKLNPSTRDVFVEGPTDRVIFEHVLKEARPFGTAVRWIDDIELDELDVAGPGGAKGRLLSLANMAKNMNCLSIICVVDRNLDAPTEIAGRQYLHATIFPDLEFHVASGSKIKEVIELSFARPLPEGAFEAAIQCSIQMYAISSLAHRDFEFPDFVDVAKSLRAGPTGINLDAAGYLLRMDSKNGSGLLFQALEEELPAVLLTYTGDPFMYVEFHSFEDCLSAVLRIRRYAVEHVSVPDWLGKLVRASVANLSSFDDFFLGVVHRVNA